MPPYKLTYFDGRGMGEGIRLIFAQVGVPFEDHRIAMGTNDYKTKAPFGQLPYLEVNGETIAQSQAIGRYLARRYGLAGKNAIEEAEVDSACNGLQDFLNDIREFFIVSAGFKKGEKEQLYEEQVVPAREKFFCALEKFLHNSDSGFLVGKWLTWADLFIAERLDKINEFAPRLFDGHADVAIWVDRVMNMPNIRKWLGAHGPSPF